MNFDQIPSQSIIDTTIKALQDNGMTAMVVDSADDAKSKVSELIPKNSEVMTMTSISLEETGIAAMINETDQYHSVRKSLEKLNRETDSKEMQRLGASPDWAIGSVHAITKDGVVIIASNTGSQLPAYVYGSHHVIWVVGAQKIVKSFEDGMKRINEYIVPLETKRARSAYGLPESFNTNVSKLLVVSREITPERITVIIVKDTLGF